MRDDSTDVQLNQLIDRVNPKFRPVWNGRSPRDQAALAAYFLPHKSSKPVIEPTRPRVVKWYCPFASQDDFPSGHRYCINVYTGCSHGCVYCYAAAYEPDTASAKARFERLVDKDMEDLERFDVPAAPVHLSNSTDPFQPLEGRFGHTRYALERIIAYRNRFTTVVILTKNPLLPVRLGYIDLLKELASIPSDHPKSEEFSQEGLPGFLMEVSLAFWKEDRRAAYDPSAPTVEERIEGIRALGEADIHLALRIDPLFPCSPVTSEPLRSMQDFGLPEAQTMEDLGNLVELARQAKVRHVIYSPAKIVQPRGRKLCDRMRALRAVYEAMARPSKLVFRGGSWRLPQDVANAQIASPFLEICKAKDVPAKHCRQNLIETL